jgi:F-type H+-transporting ATPase subunit epsilon
VAHTKFKCQVLTPEGEVFNDEVEMVSTRTGVGSLGILANHAPLMGMLEPTELRLYKTESDVQRYAQSEGYLQVVNNEVLLLVEEAVKPEDINSSDLEEKLRTCEQEAERAEEGSEERARHERDARRYRVFIDVASSSST